MARSPLTETINRVQGMITYVRDNLSTDEYMLFLDLLAPQPEPQVIQKPKRKRRFSGKSARASGMAAQLNKSLESQRKVTTTNCTKCDYDGDHNIHHLETTVGYHEFSPVPNAQTTAAGGGG